MAKNDAVEAKHCTYFVDDLGAAAYLYMMKFKVARVTKRGVLFELYGKSDKRAIEEAKMEYFNSVFVEFDNALRKLISLKRGG